MRIWQVGKKTLYNVVYHNSTLLSKCFQFNAVKVHMSIIWGPEQASIEYSANPVEVLHWRDNIGDSVQGAEIVWDTPASNLTLKFKFMKKLCTTWTWGGSISWWKPSAESVSISPSPSPLMWWSQGSEEPGDKSDDQGTHHLDKALSNIPVSKDQPIQYQFITCH